MLQTIIPVTVKDQEGCETDRVVPVTITYTVEVDPHYGADADGRRGMLAEWHEIQSATVDAPLLEEEMTQVLGDAYAIFEQEDTHR